MELTITPHTLIGAGLLLALFLIFLGFIFGAMRDDLETWPLIIIRVGIIVGIIVLFVAGLLKCFNANFNQILI